MKQSEVFLKAAQRCGEDRWMGACSALNLEGNGQPGHRYLLLKLFCEDSVRCYGIHYSYWLGPDFTQEDQQRRVYALLLAAEWAKESE